jgi:hypothetical protein
MAGLDPAIYVPPRLRKDVDARDKPGHDDLDCGAHLPPHRHCERSEAIQSLSTEAVWIASLRSQ